MNEDMQAGWDAAVAACLSGHDDCSYGGMTPSSGYWLAAEDCQLNHGDTCAWCPAEAAAGFVGWGPDGSTIWGVPACREHADAWIAGHSEWCRGAEPESEASWQELLDGLNPFAREAAEDYGRRMDEALLGDRSRLGGDGGFETGDGLVQEVQAALGVAMVEDMWGTLLFGPGGDRRWSTGPDPQPPDAIDQLLHAFHNPPEQDGPPWVHTFRLPLPEEVYMEGLDGEMVLVGRVPFLPSFTFERRPSFTGILGFLADENGGQ